jgi:hypothetical protein
MSEIQDATPSLGERIGNSIGNGIDDGIDFVKDAAKEGPVYGTMSVARKILEKEVELGIWVLKMEIDYLFVKPWNFLTSNKTPIVENDGSNT